MTTAFRRRRGPSLWVTRAGAVLARAEPDAEHERRISLSFIGWNPQNPFEYLAKHDMQLERWYKR